LNRARLLISVLIISLLTILDGGCAPPAGSGTLNVYVTDAPPREEVTSIVVTLSEVQVHKIVAEQEQEQVAGSPGS